MTHQTRFRVRFPFTITAAVLALSAVPSWGQAISAFQELVLANNSERALDVLGSDLADRTVEANLTTFLNEARTAGAGLTVQEIADAVRSPSAARAALAKAFAFAHTKSLQADAIALGGKLHYTELAVSLREEQAAVARIRSSNTSTTATSGSPFQASGSTAAASRWSITSSTPAATEVASGSTVEGRAAEIVSIAQTQATAVGADAEITQQFIALAQNDPALFTEIVGPQFGKCHLDGEADTNYMRTVIDAFNGKKAGYEVTTSVRSSLMVNTGATADEAVVNMEHLKKVCGLYGNAIAL